MQCPRCGHKYVCGCKSCEKRTNGKIRWVWTSGETEACGVCGLEASADQWFDEQFHQLSDRPVNGYASPFTKDRATLAGYRFRPGKR